MTPKNGFFPAEDVFSRGLFKIAQALELSINDLTLIFTVDKETLNEWKGKELFPSFNEQKLMVILELVQINQHLSAIFSNSKDRVLWLNAFHSHFNNSPKTLMLISFENLKNVKEYLEGVRQRGA